MKKKRQYFFAFPSTKDGKGFVKRNRPPQRTFEDLLDSIPFFLEDSSRGNLDQQGLFKIATVNDINDRGGTYVPSDPIPDDPREMTGEEFITKKAVMPYHLPMIYPYDKTVDDSDEEAHFGIGIVKRPIYYRQDYLFKARFDTLATVGSIDEENDLVVLARPSAEKNSEKSVIVPIKEILNAGGGNNSDIYSIEFTPPYIAFKEGNPNIASVLILKNGIALNLQSLDNIDVSYSGDIIDLYTLGISDGKLVIEVKTMDVDETNVNIKYSVDGSVVVERDLYVKKENVIDTYKIVPSTSIVNLGGNYGTTSEMTFVFKKNTEPYAILKNNISFNHNFNGNINYVLEMGDSGASWKITFELISNNGKYDPTEFNFEIVVDAGEAHDSKVIHIKNHNEVEDIRLEFIPNSISISTDTGNFATPLEANLYKYINDEISQLNESEVSIVPSADYNASLVQKDNYLILKVVKAADKSNIMVTLNINNNIRDAFTINWSPFYINKDTFYLDRQEIIFKAGGLSNTTYSTNLYLKDKNGDIKDLLISDISVPMSPDISFYLTQMDEKGIKYVKITIDGWTGSSEAYSSIISMIDQNSDVASITLNLTKVFDGAVGAPFHIDAQDSGHPAGKGYQNEISGFTYLDEDDSHVYFKTGDPGDDSWTAGTPFGKGDKGDPGLPPAHIWEGTVLKFYNPDGSIGTGSDLKGDKGDQGNLAIPTGSAISQTGNLILSYEDEDGSPVNVETGTSVVGPEGPPGVGSRGDDGLSINWLGEFDTVPTNPSINDAYYNTVKKASFIRSNLNEWDFLAKDGADFVRNLPNAVNSYVQLDGLTYLPEDVGSIIYVIDQEVLAVVHTVSVSGSPTFRYVGPLDSTRPGVNPPG